MIEYSHARYEQLPFFDVAHSRFSSFQPVLWELGDLICRHRLEGAVGVCLLHKHFELEPSERLVRAYSSSECVVSPHETGPNMVPCVFALKSGSALAPLEYCSLDTLPTAGDEASRLSASFPFIREAYQLLLAADALEVLGLATLGGIRHLNPGQEETVLEKNDGARRLKLEIISLDELQRVDSAQTLWRFSQSDEPGKFACPISRPDGSNGIGAHCYHCCGCLNPNFHK